MSQIFNRLNRLIKSEINYSQSQINYYKYDEITEISVIEGNNFDVTNVPVSVSSSLNGSGLYEAIKLIIEDQDSVSIASSYNFAFTILNNLISQGITLAEILDLAIRDMEDELVNIREATVSAMSIEKVNRKKYEEAEAEVKKWQDRTILAMEKGNDHLALEALKRKKFFATKVKNLEITLQQQTILSNCLKLSLFALSNKVAEAKYFQENIDFTNIKKRAIPQIAITELEDIDSDLESLKRQLDQL